jgi:hypothetical protein
VNFVSLIFITILRIDVDYTVAKKQQHLSLGTLIPKVATISHPRDLLHELLHSNAAVQLQPLLSTVEWNLDDAVLLTRRTHSEGPFLERRRSGWWRRWAGS